MCAAPEKPATARFSWRPLVKPCGYARANPARRQPELSLRSRYMHQDKKRTKGSSVMRGLGAALLLMLPAMVFAADAPPPPNKGDVSWLMTSTVLVILMTIPGLALFYGGMVRSKNVLSLLMQVMIIFCLGVLMFAIFGYSMAFTEGNSFFGGFSKVFLKGMNGDSLAATFSKATNIPELGYFCFQATFAAITPALIVG